MKNLKLNLDIKKNVTTFIATMLTAVLCVCANTTSSFLAYQPDMPQDLNRFRCFK